MRKYGKERGNKEKEKGCEKRKISFPLFKHWKNVYLVKSWIRDKRVYDRPFYFLPGSPLSRHPQPSCPQLMEACYQCNESVQFVFHQSDSNVLGLAYIWMNIFLPKGNNMRWWWYSTIKSLVVLVPCDLCTLCSAIPSKRKHKYKYKYSGLHCIVHKGLS